MFNFIQNRKLLQRQRMKKMQRILFMIVISSLWIAFAMHYSLQQKIQAYQQVLAELKLHAAQAAQPSNNESDSVKSIFDSVFAYRDVTQVILQSISDLQEKGVCFTALARQADQLIFSGQANSMTDLMFYFNHWGAAKFFSEIKIDQLNKKADGSGIEFRFRGMADQKAPNAFIKGV